MRPGHPRLQIDRLLWEIETVRRVCGEPRLLYPAPALNRDSTARLSVLPRSSSTRAHPHRERRSEITRGYAPAPGPAPAAVVSDLLNSWLTSAFAHSRILHYSYLPQQRRPSLLKFPFKRLTLSLRDYPQATFPAAPPAPPAPPAYRLLHPAQTTARKPLNAPFLLIPRGPLTHHGLHPGGRSERAHTWAVECAGYNIPPIRVPAFVPPFGC